MSDTIVFPRRDSSNATYNETAWRDRAACLGNPDAMFPDPNDTAGNLYALSVCALCPVRELCDADAEARRERYGVYGGKTENQRRKARASAGTEAGSRAVGVPAQGELDFGGDAA